MASFSKKPGLLFGKKMMPFFLALRYFWPPRSSKSNFAQVVISIGACALGSAILFLTLALSWGLCKETSASAKGAISDLVLCPKKEGSDSLNPCGAFVCNSISAWAGAVGPEGQFLNVFFRGLEPEMGATVTEIDKFIIPMAKAKSFEQTLLSEEVFVGSGLEGLLQRIDQDLILKVLIAHPQKNSRSVKLTEHKLIVAGSIKTGIADFDGATIVAANQLIKKLIGTNPHFSNFFVKIPKSDALPWYKSIFDFSLPLVDQRAESWKIKLAKNNPLYNVFSWTEFYQSFFKAIELSQLGLLIIVFLLLILALCNLASLIVLQVFFRSRDITILKILGMSSFELKTIFSVFGTLIAIVGSMGGLFFGYALAFLLQNYYRIRLPEGYPLEFLPFSCEFKFVVWIFFGILVSSFIVCYIAAKSAIKGNPAEQLKNF